MAATGMILDGVLGSEAIDSSGEVLDVAGADISDVEKGTMLLNWEHQPGEEGASTIVGKVVTARKIYRESDCQNDREKMYWKQVKVPYIYGVCRLFDGAGHDEAKRIAAIIRDCAANKELVVCRFSVEGSTLDKEDNRLKESVIRRVAVTVKPCNRTADSMVIEDPNAPPGFAKKHTRDKDILDLGESTEKFEHPLYTRLAGSTAVECNPWIEEEELEKGVGSALKTAALAPLKAVQAVDNRLSPAGRHTAAGAKLDRGYQERSARLQGAEPLVIHPPKPNPSGGARFVLAGNRVGVRVEGAKGPRPDLHASADHPAGGPSLRNCAACDSLDKPPAGVMDRAVWHGYGNIFYVEDGKPVPQHDLIRMQGPQKAWRGKQPFYDGRDKFYVYRDPDVAAAEAEMGLWQEPEHFIKAEQGLEKAYEPGSLASLYQEPDHPDYQRAKQQNLGMSWRSAYSREMRRIPNHTRAAYIASQETGLNDLSRVGHVYRGISQDEHDYIAHHGHIKSDQRGNIACDEGTCFGNQFETAASYTNGYSTHPDVTGKPTYVLEVAHHPALKEDPRDGYMKTLGDVAIPAQHIRRAWRFSPTGTPVGPSQITPNIEPEEGTWGPAGFQSNLGKAISAGVGGAAPSTLTGGAALQREDLRKRATKAIVEYKAPKFKKDEFRAHLKSELPEASDDFIDHFLDVGEDYHVRKKLVKAEKKSAKKPAEPKPKKQEVDEDEADTAVVKIAHGTVRGIPLEPNKMRGHHFDEERGIFHTPKGSFPLYNPDEGVPLKRQRGVGEPFYKDGILHVGVGADMEKIPHNPANPHFREIYLSQPIEAFHSGKVMPNWVQLHELVKKGQLPEVVAMHAAVFSMMSPNTPVRPHELMHAHMIDTWEDLGIDPRDPDFRKARRHWLGKDQGTNYPRTSTQYFKEHKDVHLANDSEGKGRQAGELMSFMLAENKFKNIAQYHQLHQTLVDMVRRHGIDARGATAELMALKHQHNLWKNQRKGVRDRIKEQAAAELGLKDSASEYFRTQVAKAKAAKLLDDRNGTEVRRRIREKAEKKGLSDDLSAHAENLLSQHPKFAQYGGVIVPGLAPKTGRFTFSMLGGGNSFVPDTHIIRHLFGLDADKDGDTIAYLKSVLWNANNHKVLEGMDRWYAAKHPAATLMQVHPEWGKYFGKNPEQANFAAFWRHWCCIREDELARGLPNTASNEFSTHEPFFQGLRNRKVIKSEENSVDHQALPKMVALAEIYDKHGEIPAQMAYFAHVVPHVLQAAQAQRQTNVNKLQGLSVEMNHALSQMRGKQPAAELAPYVPEIHAVDVRVGNTVHPAGRVLVHNGQIHHLEDYHNLLGHLLPEGPMDQQAATRLYSMSANPALVVRRDWPQEEPAAPRQAEEPRAQPVAAARPASVWHYQRAGMDQPHTLEAKSGSYLLDGNPLSDQEVRTILANVRQGSASLRYVSGGAWDRVRKMEATVINLFKSMDGYNAQQRDDVHDALQAFRQAVADGHIDEKHGPVMTKLVYEDRMVPKVGNQYAAMKFLQLKRPGVYIQLDGNDFGEINNGYGHPAGDEALRSFGKYARAAMDEAVGRENSKLFRSPEPDEQDIYRNGGDEFLAWVPSYEHAAKFARALTTKLDAHPPIGGVHKLSMSMGFGLDRHAADVALYEAKKQKYVEGSENRKYAIGQTPCLAYSNVPGFEGPVPVADPGQAAVQHVMSHPEVQDAEPAKVGMEPKPGLAAPKAA